MLRVERHSARVSKVTNDGLTRSDTGCFSCTHMATVDVKGLRWTLMDYVVCGSLWCVMVRDRWHDISTLNKHICVCEHFWFRKTVCSQPLVNMFVFDEQVNRVKQNSNILFNLRLKDDRQRFLQKVSKKQFRTVYYNANACAQMDE